MDATSDNQIIDTRTIAAQLGQFIAESKAKNVVVLDVAETCSWAEVFVIATYNSQGHLRGLIGELDDWSAENYPDAGRRPKKNQVNDWMLIDWGDIVIHLFSENARTYYELEKLWFSAKPLFHSS